MRALKPLSTAGIWGDERQVGQDEAEDTEIAELFEDNFIDESEHTRSRDSKTKKSKTSHDNVSQIRQFQSNYRYEHQENISEWIVNGIASVVAGSIITQSAIEQLDNSEKTLNQLSSALTQVRLVSIVGTVTRTYQLVSSLRNVHSKLTNGN